VDLALGLLLLLHAPRGRYSAAVRRAGPTDTATRTGLPRAASSAAFSLPACAASAYCGTGTRNVSSSPSHATSSL
ncbi:hypothetical protein, partial [Mycetohabitans sp. B46]|uniref:hypothetical protein n=1 Tax=Mycetohabitans sp. B46 TaxID=2772536 RepID=UPI003FD5C5B4